MKQVFAFIAVLCGLMLPHAAFACMFANAEYMPDPHDYRTKSDYYYYKITVTPGLHLMLNVVHPLTKQVVTKLNMQYSAKPSAIVTLSAAQGMEVEFFDKSLLQIPIYSGTDEAPATMILRDSYNKFLELDDNGLDIEYFSDPKVKPGANVENHLELVPDVWVFSKCWDN